MTGNDIERQLLWYKYSKSHPESHEYYILLINEQREIKGIKQQLHDELKPIVEERLIDKGKIENSDLFYNLFCMVSTKSELDLSRVYQGKVRKDRRLQPRMTLGGWNDFIEKVHHGEI
ncbi:MAG: hypothetical protein AABW47_01445 [Nanoarchaeota archaeon]